MIAGVLVVVVVLLAVLISTVNSGGKSTAAGPTPSHEPSTIAPAPAPKATVARPLTPVTGIASTHPPTATHKPKPAPGKGAPSPAIAKPKPKPKPQGPSPVGSWRLGAGGSSLTADTTDGAHALTSSHVTKGTGHGGCAVFNGTNSEATTAGSVLNTAGDFTVSAWVYLTKNTGFATAVSQDGTTDSGFYLQYSSQDQRWAFAVPGGRALSSGPPPLNTWVHLVGVVSTYAKQLRLVVNGEVEGITALPKLTSTTGDLVIGRGQWNGGPMDWFPGAVNDVEVFNRALTDSQVRAL